MSVDLICPECGGIIGGVGVDAQGRGPCTCFENQIGGSRHDEKPDQSDTVSILSPPSTSASPVPIPIHETTDGPVKICLVCGKNVAGHRRVKDSRGYLCYPCAKAEVKQEKAGTVPCAECGRRIKEKGLINYLGIKICRRCYDDHKQAKKKSIKKVATKEYEAHERRNVIILAVIFVILGLIVLFTQMRH